MKADVVILGASNVSIGLPFIVQGVRNAFAGGARLWCVHGHGRSYGKPSRLPWRGLSGVIESEFWEDLADARAAGKQAGPLFGLATDVGNDLIYGRHPDQILDWVQECGRRLIDQGGELTVTGLPVGSLLSLSAPRYHATQRMFFPDRSSSWPEMKAMIRSVDDGTKALAERLGASHVRPERHWYGFDPIHVRRTRRREAWGRYLSAWPSGPAVEVPTVPVRLRRKIHRLGFALKTAWPKTSKQREVRVEQPSLVDGSFEYRGY